MASDGNPGSIPVTAPVQGSQGTTPTLTSIAAGNALPLGGKNAAPAAPRAATASATTPLGRASAAAVVIKTPVPQTTDPQSLVRNLNKFLNDSGRPDQFRLDPASGGKLIQQINPSSGAVIGEFSATEFPALARSVGVAGLLVDDLA